MNAIILKFFKTLYKSVLSLELCRKLFSFFKKGTYNLEIMNLFSFRIHVENKNLFIFKVFYNGV